VLSALGAWLAIKRARRRRQGLSLPSTQPSLYQANYADPEIAVQASEEKEESSLVEQLALFRVAEISRASASTPSDGGWEQGPTAPPPSAQPPLCCQRPIGTLGTHQASSGGGSMRGLVTSGVCVASSPAYSTPSSARTAASPACAERDTTGTGTGALKHDDQQGQPRPDGDNRSHPVLRQMMVDGDVPIGLLPGEAAALEELRREEDTAPRHVAQTNGSSSNQALAPASTAIFRARQASDAMRI
jgi:hypothetical protein